LSMLSDYSSSPTESAREEEKRETLSLIGRAEEEKG